MMQHRATTSRRPFHAPSGAAGRPLRLEIRRATVPEVRPVLGLMDYLGQASDVELRIHLSPEAELSLRDLPKPAGPTVLAVGPEGGFSDKEQDALRQSGFVAVNLGPRVLRTETAALAALSAMQILWGDY